MASGPCDAGKQGATGWFRSATVRLRSPRVNTSTYSAGGAVGDSFSTRILPPAARVGFPRPWLYRPPGHRLRRFPGDSEGAPTPARAVLGAASFSSGIEQTASFSARVKQTGFLSTAKQPIADGHETPASLQFDDAAALLGDSIAEIIAGGGSRNAISAYTSTASMPPTRAHLGGQPPRGHAALGSMRKVWVLAATMSGLRSAASFSWREAEQRPSIPSVVPACPYRTAGRGIALPRRA